MNCKNIRQKVSIRAVLESFSRFPVKENRRTAFYFALDRDEKVPSLSVDYVKNTAFDFGTGKSYDVISIVQQIKQCSVSEALQYLSALDLSFDPGQLPVEKPSEVSYKILKIKKIRHPALIQYLDARKVLEQKHFLKQIDYEFYGRKYFGIAFENNSGGIEVRNTYTKLCLGLKDVTLVRAGSEPTSEIAVFEGFFDFLTFRNLENKLNSGCDCLILNSTAMLFKAEQILQEYPKILLFLDNDPNGKSVALKIRNDYQNVEDCSLIYHGYKDLNEWLIKTKEP
ncbi:toprim domain-containing protein [Chryseobacterium sp. Y16C]|uniref:toprim domain-containing protein n=1 Tax=Chryseobacterium sp. Y16C TaxID=2920939 RepID=UPI001F0B2774|nr:toprim domain-containing protein [Chryseobacterium sp. Y16C]MCT4319258.1 toprim domain-containing protein [Elizabethkingia anophelis]UMQ40548.1 toprim domain-containing protein [Chryseobacterium sp. Y16C]